MDQYASVEAAFLDGRSCLDSLFLTVQDGILCLALGNTVHSYIFNPSSLGSNMTEEEYRLAVLKAKTSLSVGDHLVLSKRFERRFSKDPFHVYRVLGSQHCSPFRTYVKGRTCILVSINQDILISLKKRKITKQALSWVEKSRIPEEELEALLMGDKKEGAKHMRMLDLEKLDVEKVCKVDSVAFEKIREIEQHSRVIYMSSTVTGDLLEHLSCWDALQAALPSAVVTGAPKAKAMELIDQLEPSRRGPYGGGIGCISFFGDMEMSVASDLIVFKTETKVAHMQVGVTIKGVL